MPPRRLAARRWTLGFLAGFITALAARGQLLPANPEPTVLARVEVRGPTAPTGLAAHEWLRDRAGSDYLLVFARLAELRQCGWPYQVLDTPAQPPDAYVLATEMRSGAFLAANGHGTLLLDDGWQWLLRASATEAEALAETGLALKRLTTTPIVWPAHRRQPKDGGPGGGVFTPDPRVAAMVEAVQSTNLFWLLRRLSGEEPVLAGGEPAVLTSRHTTSGVPLSRALAFAFERLQALGLEPRFHTWTNAGYINRNLSASLVGGARSNEWVLLTAHLDDMPSGARAPGADDNASGCAAVLTAAGVLRQFQFERSVRFVLFTGEEQGLLGSARYAQAAQAAGENLAAVINLDMIAWATNPVAKVKLYTRTVVNPAFSNDLAIARCFTNVTAAYGLAGTIAPVIAPEALQYSDHASFWNRGYPAIVAIEDYGGDFNPYYHTTGDTVARVNWRFFTAFTRASVATAAHFAGPLQATGGDVLEVAASTWTTNSGVGAGAWFAKPGVPPAQAGLDAADLAWSNAPAPAQAQWLRVFSEVSGAELQTDARPVAEDVRFLVNLSAGSSNGVPFACSNRLRFDFLTPASADRIYTARIQTAAAFNESAEAFLCFTNLRDTVAQGGYVALPNLTGLTDGARYGNCEIAVRQLRTNRTDCPIWFGHSSSNDWHLMTRAQVGTRVVDTVEFSPTLANGRVWAPLQTFTNTLAPDAANFDRGWQDLAYPVAIAPPTPGGQGYFRLRRTWLAP